VGQWEDPCFVVAGLFDHNGFCFCCKRLGPGGKNFDYYLANVVYPTGSTGSMPT
jgi:hypothetical protein